MFTSIDELKASLELAVMVLSAPVGITVISLQDDAGKKKTCICVDDVIYIHEAANNVLTNKKIKKVPVWVILTIPPETKGDKEHELDQRAVVRDDFAAVVQIVSLVALNRIDAILPQFEPKE